MATPEICVQMLDLAKEHGFAYPAIKVTSSHSDPTSWGKAAEAGMAARVVHACEDLLSAGNRLT